MICLMAYHSKKMLKLCLLCYNLFADSNYDFHWILVDAGNGKILTFTWETDVIETRMAGSVFRGVTDCLFFSGN